MLGNDDVARCDFVWRQPGLKRHLPSRLPDDADDFASLRSDVVQLVTESRWLIADRIDSVLLASDNDPPAGSLMQCGAFLRHPAALAQLAKGKAAASVRSIANATRNRMHQGEHLNVLDLDSTDHFNLVGRLTRSPAPQRTERTNDMNDKNDLLLIEAMDLITRASGMIDLLRAEDRREEAWTLPLETAAEHLSDAHKQLEALSVNAPRPHATAA